MIEQAIIDAVVKAINDNGSFGLSASQMRDGRILVEVSEHIGGNSWRNLQTIRIVLKVDQA